MYIISLPVSTFSLHCICGINAPQNKRNSLCDSKQEQSILTSDPQMICEAHSHPSQEKPCIMVRNAAFRALLSLLERMAKPLLGHSRHISKSYFLDTEATQRLPEMESQTACATPSWCDREASHPACFLRYGSRSVASKHQTGAKDLTAVIKMSSYKTSWDQCLSNTYSVRGICEVNILRP